MSAIRTNDLTKRYGDVTALDGVSLSVEAGEVFGFLGPNGAGKSTTIDVLLDYVRPTSGSATVLGHDPQVNPRAVHERIGVLPQGYDLYDRLTGREHIAFAGRAKGTDPDPSALLDRVGLDETDADRAVGGYSTGMQQRLALAMALVGEPELLILDEPASGLDPHGIRRLQQLVRAEVERGTTVFLSSHVLERVESVCDRVGILRDGRLVAEDSIETLRETVGAGTTLELTLDERPTAVESLAELDGVRAVTADGTTVEIACTDPTAKIDAIDRLRDGGATVVDLRTDETSLGELFDAYTRSGSDGSPAHTDGERGAVTLGESDPAGEVVETVADADDADVNTAIEAIET